MKQWSTDASFNADTRYPWVVRFAFRFGAPFWLLNVLTRATR